MPKILKILFVALCALNGIFLSSNAIAHSAEVFAKASASKSYLSSDSYTVSISGASGVAILLIPQVRIEGRYTMISQMQNKQDVTLSDGSQASITNNISQTSIFSVGFDIDILSDKHTVQPFIYLGAGYIQATRTYNLTQGNIVVPSEELKSSGISGNVGAGFRVRIGRSLAFEIEAFGYGQDIQKPNPLVNLFGSAGIRIFM